MLRAALHFTKILYRIVISQDLQCHFQGRIGVLWIEVLSHSHPD
jgi:hypothetical protein